jgi:hypothetical protein
MSNHKTRTPGSKPLIPNLEPFFNRLSRSIEKGLGLYIEALIACDGEIIYDQIMAKAIYSSDVIVRFTGR